MPSLLEQLNDIEGIDAISPWPLAIGWWVSFACAMLVLGIPMWMLKRRLDYARSWKRDAFKKLNHLEKNLSLETSAVTIKILSEYLRRIAVRRFPRKECAGLIGVPWLKWLKTHDPKQFDWTEKGKPLIEIPYAPTHIELPPEMIKELIQAIRYWVY